jgi:ABC-2 type transport system ATP-binding protein
VRSPESDRLVAALLESRPASAVVPDGAGALHVTGWSTAEIGRLAHEQRVELHELANEAGDLERLFLELTQGVSR